MDDILTLKQTGLSVGLVSVFTYLGIDQEVFLLYSILLFIDFILGFLKAFLKGKATSKQAFLGFFGKMTLLLLIFSIGIFGKINNYEMSYIMSGIFSLLSLVELYSIVGHIYTIRTGKEVKEYDATAVVLSYLLKVVKNGIEKLLKNNELNNEKKGK